MLNYTQNSLYQTPGKQKDSFFLPKQKLENDIESGNFSILIAMLDCLADGVVDLDSSRSMHDRNGIRIRPMVFLQITFFKRKSQNIRTETGGFVSACNSLLLRTILGLQFFF